MRYHSHEIFGNHLDSSAATSGLSHFRFLANASLYNNGTATQSFLA
jgi:hypothetical protein